MSQSDTPSAFKETFSPNASDCILCFKRLGKPEKDVTRNPTPQGLTSIFETAELKDDIVHKRLGAYKEDIISLKLKVAYHRSCRASYTSKSHRKTKLHDPVECVEEDAYPASKRLKRDGTQTFDIRTHCFICGKPPNPRGSAEKLTAITTDTGLSTREKVLNAAERRNDNVVHMRMLIHTDLFAYDAKYHRKCYSHYISERNILASQRKHEGHHSAHSNSFQVLVEHIRTNVLSKHEVASLSAMLAMYKSESKKEGHDSIEQYTSWKLKQKLLAEFKDELVFVDRKGKSDLICSSSMSVGDALRKAASLEEALDSANKDDDLTDSTLHLDESQILHHAAGILRKHMASVDMNDNSFYMTSNELRFHECAKIVPDRLYDFISWLYDRQAYMDVKSVSEDGKKDNLRVVATCHNLISQSCNITTPISFGLALTVHHLFGSRQFVDYLYALGLGVSYDDIRKFLTSVAKEQSRSEYIPYQPCSETAGSNDDILVDAAIDNFDRNEDTLDGKSSTHAMAGVLYRRSKDEVQSQRIPRINKKSLLPSDTVHVDTAAVKRFNRPHSRPQPPSSSGLNLASETAERNSVAKDELWKLLRSHTDSTDMQQIIPAWTGFNSLVSQSQLPVATVRYLPFLCASPSDLSVIYTMLMRIVAVSTHIKQQHILVTADMAIYSKAQEILWSKPPTLDGKVTMRIGGMHLTMTFMACIGRLYGDGGLLSILSDSTVYAEATARQMLQGKQYSRGIRGLKLAQDALTRLFTCSMSSWAATERGQSVPSAEGKRLLSDIVHAFAMQNKVLVKALMDEFERDHLPDISHMTGEFRRHGREQSQTFAYWDSFLYATDILLQLLRAEKEGDFELHLSATQETIPWIRAAGRHVYARFLPIYLSDMKKLEQQQPASYQHLKNGGFVVRRSDNHAFNAVASDMALEQTINKEGKGKGGVVGLTLRKGALTRWLITRHVTAEYCESFKSLCNTTERSNPHHAETNTGRMKRDENDVQKIQEFIASHQNPFDLETVPSEMIHIISGKIADCDVSLSLKTFHEKGNMLHEEFVKKRLVENSVSFWAPDARMKLKTFSDMTKMLTSKEDKKLMLDSEVLFRRLLAVSQSRDVCLEEVLSHELAAVPPALFNDDGSMRKTTKADLAKKIEGNLEEVHVLTGDDSTAYIIDGMAYLQSIKDSQFKTFNDLGNVVLQKTKRVLATMNTSCVALVFDRYDNSLSIKQAERSRRGSSVHDRASYDISGTRNVPNYRSFLRNNSNKAALARFLSAYLEETLPKNLETGQSVILAGGYKRSNEAKIIQENGCHDDHELYSEHDEADTRMVFHAIRLSSNYDRIIIRSDDTDVLIILLYFCSVGKLAAQVFMHAGHSGQTTNRERYIPVTQLVETLGNAFIQCLPALHAITGCDTTSSTYMIGKKKAYTKLKQNMDILKDLRHFGEGYSFDVNCATKLMLTLYGQRKRDTGEYCSTLNELRYILATQTDMAAAQLPPTDDAFKQHVMRAAFQTAIWKSCDLASPRLPDPIGNGWVEENGLLVPIFYTLPAAPVGVRDLTHLFCKDKLCKSGQKCPCVMASLPCIELCMCIEHDCGNRPHDCGAQDSDDDA